MVWKVVTWLWLPLNLNYCIVITISYLRFSLITVYPESVSQKKSHIILNSAAVCAVLLLDFQLTLKCTKHWPCYHSQLQGDELLVYLFLLLPLVESWLTELNRKKTELSFFEVIKYCKQTLKNWNGKCPVAFGLPWPETVLLGYFINSSHWLVVVEWFWHLNKLERE